MKEIPPAKDSDPEFDDVFYEHGEFWFDVLLRFKKNGELDQIIDLCTRKLPLPAAFEEMAIALRKKIRALRQTQQPYDSQLRQLYELAIYERFLYPSPSVTLEGGDSYPTYNVAEIAHTHHTRDRLSYDYQTIGYQHLPFLKKTDRKWLVEVWGEPAQHQDPHLLHHALWQQGVTRFEKQLRTIA